MTFPFPAFKQPLLIDPFPRLMGVPATLSTVSGTTVAIPLPAGITAGERLLMFHFGLSAAAIPSALTGWTLLTSHTETGSCVRVWTKVADGAEGTSINGTFGGTGGKFSAALRFRGVNGAPEATNAGFLDPAALTPSWGNKNTAWLTACGGGCLADAGGVFSSFPTGYDLLQLQPTSVFRLIAGVAMRKLKAASDDPSAFVTSAAASGTRSNVTVALRPLV
jgi:hypothetical protein